ncbi:MAG: DUF86 domain-containing protein [Bacteroidales bacterium]|nr:DUF86 domain-containing protein [Bacteroidales bacterium]
MYQNKERVSNLLNLAIQEMELLGKMSAEIICPDDFVTSISGMTVFRACGMSLQFITESFVKIRNLCGPEFFSQYKTIPWPAVFGMRNFLSHEYGDVDAEGIYNTVKDNIPKLLGTSKQMLKDVQSGELDQYL